jgi:hypothetical protein
MSTQFPKPAGEERNERIRDKLKREMGDLIFNCLASSETIEIGAKCGWRPLGRAYRAVACLASA